MSPALLAAIERIVAARERLQGHAFADVLYTETLAIAALVEPVIGVVSPAVALRLVNAFFGEDDLHFDEPVIEYVGIRWAAGAPS